MITAGSSEPLGATCRDGGTNFAVYSAVAERVELCLFDAAGHQTAAHPLRPGDDGVWHGFLPGCRPGQTYGYRVHGRYAPDAGLRCNPAKLLLDPYARELSGKFRWDDAVFDDNAKDSAAFVPKSVVTEFQAASEFNRPRPTWSESIIYEANVRGYTMRHPAVPPRDRGKFVGMRNREVLAYLKALGITSLELMPVHAFIDEQHLVERGLRNAWGYNSISFFAPSVRYACAGAVTEFRDMVRAIHDCGIEVILDVVYNHTGEGGASGPALCFKGLDNLAYYSTEPGDPGTYINDTGCGNTINVDHPRVRQLILDSLRYWHADMGVDGFRFDLAPVLGRHNHGYAVSHPMLEAISRDPILRHAKLIAEPWDPGPGGYQLGHFPRRWAEWNDRYRDSVRRFWRCDAKSAADFASRLHGSSDIFEWSGRAPLASINYVASHDGFTLADVVSYEQKHNDANGEDNRDGHAHNFSCNYGIEGPTGDEAILAIRRRQRLNMLATLFFSQGTPMLLAGDEFGHSQQGNNNAYAQDNEITWLDWERAASDPDFLADVRRLIRLRKATPLLRLRQYVHGRLQDDDGIVEIGWFSPQGERMADADWQNAASVSVLISRTAASGQEQRVAILINGTQSQQPFFLPGEHSWQVAFASAPCPVSAAGSVELDASGIALLLPA
jgi:glycogen operon protein